MPFCHFSPLSLLSRYPGFLDVYTGVRTSSLKNDQKVTKSSSFTPLFRPLFASFDHFLTFRPAQSEGPEGPSRSVFPHFYAAFSLTSQLYRPKED